jgi:cation diffusion facilitator family transporter
MAYESTQRLISPVRIEYREAMIVAAIGLAVNLASAFLLGGHHHDHHDGHDHQHEHGEGYESASGHSHDGHHHHDHNLRAAYMHVLADALTSLLALVALAGGSLFGLLWLDPAMGIVGAAVILSWSWGLVRGTSGVLLDQEASGHKAEQIRARIEADADNRVVDLHLWQVGTGHLALVVSVITHQPRPPAHYKALLRGIDHLSHVTVEVVPCGDAAKG